jgi:hypothetical protein
MKKSNKSQMQNEPLVARLNYSPSRSVLIRDLENLLQTRAARGQHGYYYENNMATYNLNV